MATYSSEWVLKLTDGITAPLKGITSAVTKAMGGFGSTQLHFNQASIAADNFKQMIDGIIAPAVAFNQSQKELQAITNVSNEQLEGISEKARKLAKTFGVDASGAMDAYGKILSDLGPAYAQNAPALDALGRSATILSKQLGGDVSRAVSVLDQALMNYGKNLDDPIAASRQMFEMMNIMSKAASEGKVTMEGIEKIMQSAGVNANLAGIDFYDLNAAIQAAGQMNPAEMGTSFARLFSGMQTAGDKGKIQDTLKDLGVNMEVLTSKTAPLYARLVEVKKIANSGQATSLLTTLFGEEGIKAASILVGKMEEVKAGAGGIRDAIVNHQNDAIRQAETVMGGYSETMSRMTTRFNDFKISIFDATKEWLPFIVGATNGIAALGQLPASFEFLKSTKGFINSLFSDTKKTVFDSVTAAVNSMGQIATSGGNSIKLGMNQIGAFIASLRSNPGTIVRGFFAPVMSGFTAVVQRSKIAILWTKGFLYTLRTNPASIIRGFFAPILMGFSSLKTSIGGAIVKFYTFITTLTVAQIKTALWGGVVSIVTGIQWLWNTALSMNPIGLFIIAIAGLAAGMIYLYKHSETVRNIFANIGVVVGWVWEKIKSFFSYIFDAMGNLLTPVADFLGISTPKIEVTPEMQSGGEDSSGGLLGGFFAPVEEKDKSTTYDTLPNKKDKEGSSGSRNVVVNFAANSIQIMQGAKVQGGEVVADIKKQVTEVIVSAIRDAEIIAAT